MSFPKLVKILLFECSRKVGFGLWLFVVATVLLYSGKIDADNWILCVTFSSALGGGGTIADKYLQKKDETPTP